MQYLRITYNGREHKKKIYICPVSISETLCCAPKLTQHCTSTIFQEKIFRKDFTPGSM